MFGRYQQWRHAGEEHAIAIYRYSIRGDLVAAVIVSLFVGLGFLALADNKILELLSAATFLCLTASALAKRRIAVIFTESELIYRPALGSPRRFRLSGIQGISRGRIYVPWELFPLDWGAWRPGIVLKLPYNQSFQMRLDLPRSDEIAKRLSDMSSISINRH